MDRRGFLKMCAISGVPAGHEGKTMECNASNVAFSHEQMMATSPETMEGVGEWSLKISGDSIKIQVSGENFYGEIRMEGFSEKVDYVRGMAMRELPSPTFDKFTQVFGFNGD